MSGVLHLCKTDEINKRRKLEARGPQCRCSKGMKTLALSLSNGGSAITTTSEDGSEGTTATNDDASVSTMSADSTMHDDDSADNTERRWTISTIFLRTDDSADVILDPGTTNTTTECSDVAYASITHISPRMTNEQVVPLMIPIASSVPEEGLRPCPR